VLRTWVVAGFSIVLGGLVWYTLNLAMQLLIETMTGQYPSYYHAATNLFIKNIWINGGFIIMITVLIYVIVQSHKERGREVIYQ